MRQEQHQDMLHLPWHNLTYDTFQPLTSWYYHLFYLTGEWGGGSFPWLARTDLPYAEVKGEWYNALTDTMVEVMAEWFHVLSALDAESEISYNWKLFFFPTHTAVAAGGLRFPVISTSPMPCHYHVGHSPQEKFLYPWSSLLNFLCVGRAGAGHKSNSEDK